jgi:small subunit ribosomal protein S21
LNRWEVTEAVSYIENYRLVLQLAPDKHPRRFSALTEDRPMQVFVRDNNVEQALRVLKKKMQREGLFREMRRRRFYEKPSEEAARKKSDAVRRMRKLERKQAIRDGSIAAPPPKKKEIKHRAAFPVQAWSEHFKLCITCLRISYSTGRLATDPVGFVNYKESAEMRYYFDIRDGEALYSDEEGIEFHDQTAAEIEAANSLANMARDLSPLDERHHMAIEVRTTAGPVFQAAFHFETAPHKR